VNRSSKTPAASVLAAIIRLLIALVRELAPTVLFFFVAFLMIFVMFRLFAQKYSIEFSALSKAAIGALILGKVIPLLEWSGSRYSFGTHRRIVVIASKTIVYGLVVTVLATAEKIFHGIRETGSLHGGISAVIANANLDRFFGLVLLFSLVVGSYLLLQEIERAMGKGALLRLLFARPHLKAGGNASVRPTGAPNDD
jgi:hypothetical protein